MEVELLLSSKTKDDNIHCIRLNPTDYSIGGKNIGIGLGAKEALESIMQHLYPSNPPFLDLNQT